MLATSTISDTNVNQPGLFSTTSILTGGTFTAPAVGTLLSIRFYNGFTAATSTRFNAASDTSGGWNWVAPADIGPVLNLQITKENSVFQTGMIGAFQTEISTKVPEPSTSLLLSFSSAALVFRRKR